MRKWILTFVAVLALASCGSGGGVGSSSEGTAADAAPASGLTLARSLAEVEAYSGPAGADPRLIEQLKSALHAALVEHQQGRLAAATTFDPRSQTELKLNTEDFSLVWGYYSTGDYDQNGEVNASDLTPIAINFGKTGEFHADSAEALVDGDGNGEINTSDITPIAVNFGATITGYRVYTSMSAEDYPESESAPSGPGTQLLTTVLLPPGPRPEDRLQLKYVLDPQARGFFWVRPSDGNEVGSPSSLLEVQPQFNLNPVAVLKVTPANGDTPLLVSFDASDSTDPDGQIVKYEFDWDGPVNGENWADNGQDPAVSHSYTSVGVYTAVLRVTDNRGATDTDAKTITVTPPGNDPPQAALQSNKSGGELPLQVIFDASASFDPDGFIARFEWDFDGDGETDGDSGTDSVLNHTYFEPGVFAATVRVFDNGGLSDTASVEITVTGNAQDWKMFRRDFRHSGRSEYIGPGADYLHPWSHQTEGAVTSSPVIGLDGTIYVGSEDGYLYALRPNNTRKWRFPANQPVLSSPAIDRLGNLYFGCDSGEFITIDAEGDIRWRVNTGGDIQASPLVTPDERVYFGSGDGNLYCYSASGSELWKFETTGQIRSSPVLDMNGNIVFGHSSGFIYAVTEDGDEAWTYETDGYVASSPAVAPDGTIYIGSDDNFLYALHPDGSFYWSYETGDNVFSSPAIDVDGTVYVGGIDGFLYSFTPEGELNWKFPAGGQLWSSPAIGGDGKIYIGCTDDQLYAINPDNTLDWTYLTGNIIHSSVAIATDGSLYFGGEDSFLHCLRRP